MSHFIASSNYNKKKLHKIVKRYTYVWYTYETVKITVSPICIVANKL